MAGLAGEPLQALQVSVLELSKRGGGGHLQNLQEAARGGATELSTRNPPRVPWHSIPGCAAVPQGPWDREQG